MYDVIIYDDDVRMVIMECVPRHIALQYCKMNDWKYTDEYGVTYNLDYDLTESDIE